MPIHITDHSSGLHPADIICALTKAGYSQQKIATQLKVDRTLVNNVIHRRLTSYNVASYISAITDLPMSRMWPDGRYSKPRNKEYGT